MCEDEEHWHRTVGADKPLAHSSHHISVHIKKSHLWSLFSRNTGSTCRILKTVGPTLYGSGTARIRALQCEARVPRLTGHSVIKTDNKQCSVSGTQTQSPSRSQWCPGRRRMVAPAKMQQNISGIELPSIQVRSSFRCYCRRWKHSCTSLTT